MAYKILWAVLTALVTYLSIEATGWVIGFFVSLGFAALALDMCDNADIQKDGRNY